MRFEKANDKIRYLYHYTTKENAKKILAEKCIRTGNDRFCFFTESPGESRLLFSELMEKSINYIDDSLQVAKSVPKSADDYTILKIRATNDGLFYRFTINADGFNPYKYSLLHLGVLRFERATELPVKEEKTYSGAIMGKVNRSPLANALKKSVAACMAAAIIGLCAIPSHALSAPSGLWTDTLNYDASWYDDSAMTFKLTSAEQLAGITPLVNNGHNFAGKTVTIENELDLSAHTWVTIPEGFLGTVDGAHKLALVMFSNDIPFAADMERVKNIEFRYKNYITSEVEYAVPPEYTVTIPPTIKLGEPIEISVDNVVVDEGKQVEVKLTGTGEEDNTFKLRTVGGTELSYTITSGERQINVGDTVLSVKPNTEKCGKCTLVFRPSSPVIYSGIYRGSVTFTVSITAADS